MNLENFIEDLSSEKPAPGGGGASAMFGVVGSALTSMVCALTKGKKAYLEFDDFVRTKHDEILQLQTELSGLIKADAEVYLVLNKAYKLPKDTPEQEKIRQNAITDALKPAAKVPLQIMQLCANGIDITESLLGKTTKFAVSDLGCAAMGFKAGIKSAWLNVKINLNCSTDPMDDIEKPAREILDKYIAAADDLYKKVENLL